MQDPQRLNKRAEDYLQEFREAQNLLSVQATSGSVQSRVSWSPPSGLIYKLNFDTVVFEGISALGFRAVVRNDGRSDGSHFGKGTSSSGQRRS